MPSSYVALIVGLILAVVIGVPLQRWLCGGQPQPGPIEPPDFATSDALEWGYADEVAYREACKKGEDHG